MAQSRKGASSSEAGSPESTDVVLSKTTLNKHPSSASDGVAACRSEIPNVPCSCCEKADRSLEILGQLLGKEFISSDVIYFMLCGLRERGMEHEARVFLQGFAKSRSIDTHRFMG